MLLTALLIAALAALLQIVEEGTQRHLVILGVLAAVQLIPSNLELPAKLFEPPVSLVEKPDGFDQQVVFRRLSPRRERLVHETA